MVDVVDGDGVDDGAGFPFRAPIGGAEDAQFAVVFEGGDGLGDFVVAAFEPVEQFFEGGFSGESLAVPSGPEGAAGVAEGVVGVHGLDRAAVDDEVAHGAAAGGGELVEALVGDGGEVGEERVFGLALEGLVELPDEVAEDFAAHASGSF